MPYLALLLIAFLAIVAYAPGLPADVAGVPTEPASAAIRSVFDAAGGKAREWGMVLRDKGMGLLRTQLHDAIDETVR